MSLLEMVTLVGAQTVAVERGSILLEPLTWPHLPARPVLAYHFPSHEGTYTCLLLYTLQGDAKYAHCLGIFPGLLTVSRFRGCRQREQKAHQAKTAPKKTEIKPKSSQNRQEQPKSREMWRLGGFLTKFRVEWIGCCLLGQVSTLKSNVRVIAFTS